MKLLQEKIFARQDLTQEETTYIFKKMMSGEESDLSIASTLIGLKVKGESPREVAGAAQVLRANASIFEKPNYPVADSCGTGGSGKHTLNISTLVSFIAAAQGLKMVKHGNRSVSSKCGSADVLEQLGVNINMTSQKARQCVDEIGVTFLFAPLYHPTVKSIMPVRNALATRTIFNLLGPLINPANPEYQLMGVYSADYCYAAAESLRLSGCKAAMVVHSCGCDEITLSGKTHVAELKNGEITEYDLMPEDFGLTIASLDNLVGGTPEDNADIFKQVLKGEASEAIQNTIAANAGALFYLSEVSESIKEGVKQALSIIQQGTVFEKLTQLAALSQEEVNNEK